MDLIMIRSRKDGRILYAEQLERLPGESPWEYARRSARRENQLSLRFAGPEYQLLVGWGTGSVEEFLEAHPEYRPPGTARGERRSSG
ncbi:hypothetical protein E0L93_09980 [Rubrobacter taiwanensis]|uniref:Uncharacterized protein n=1 Tax=Rubrobacter taiwanensis TaxID=185139 RepID=A0A4R1BGV1_9ACTN|nr:hypothetical protein [Rubrobacter taiwanensis]TCJ16440.1 hypothetical protein E0L93_09980 [Rubrobacter taiwanensis]